MEKITNEKNEVLNEPEVGIDAPHRKTTISPLSERCQGLEFSATILNGLLSIGYRFYPAGQGTSFCSA